MGLSPLSMRGLHQPLFSTTLLTVAPGGLRCVFVWPMLCNLLYFSITLILPKWTPAQSMDWLLKSQTSSVPQAPTVFPSGPFSQSQRSLVGYSPRDGEESDTTYGTVTNWVWISPQKLMVVFWDKHRGLSTDNILCHKCPSFPLIIISAF